MTRTPKKTTPSTAKRATPSTAKKAAPRKASAKAEPEKTVPEKTTDKAAETVAEKTASPSPAPSTAAASSGSTSSGSSSSGGPWIGAIAVVLVLGIVVAGAVASRDVWWPYATPYLPESTPPEDPRVAALMDRLGALEERVEGADAEEPSNDAAFAELEAARTKLSTELAAVIARLESVEAAVDSVERMATVMGSEGDTAGAEQSLLALAGRVDSLEKASDLTPMAERLDTLEQMNRAVEDSFSRETELIEQVKRRLESLEAQRIGIDGNSASGASALILAIGQLRTAVRQGQPFAGQLENTASVAADLSGADDMLATLRQHADQGVASRDALRRSFDETALMIIQADRRLEGDGWMAEAVNRLSDLVTVRRVDETAAPDTTDARLQRAEAGLAMGDLALAIDMLAGLEGSALEAAQPWLTRARETLSVEQALIDLNAFAISQLSAAQG